MTFVKKQCGICGETYDVMPSRLSGREMDTEIRISIPTNYDSVTTRVTYIQCCPKCAEEVKKFIDDKRKE